MPDEKDSLWEGFRSQDLFSDDDAESLSETVPVNQITSSLAENRRILQILFLIDVSGSMRGQRIAQVNYALESIFKELNRRDDADSTIKIGIMEFSDEARWITPQPVPLEDHVFTQITVQPWVTNYAKAFDLLDQKLSKKEFMNPNRGEYFAPLILLITDGEPVDAEEYPKALERLRHNGWFRQSAKYAVAVGEEARNEEIAQVLSEFTGLKQNVRYADEGEALCDLIEYIAVRASEVQTSLVSSSFDQQRDPDSIFGDVDASLFSSMLQNE